MKVFFKDSRGQMREIALLDSDLDKDKAMSAVMSEIKKFCDERNFKIYYTRVWCEEKDGIVMTKFDVGSHTEFFYVDRALM